MDCEESRAPKNWCFWTVVLEKTLESPLDCKEIQPVHPKGYQSWVIIGSTDVEALEDSSDGAGGRRIDLDYHDIEWFVLEMNRDHSVVFEIASKYCISDSSVDYEGYSISSKRWNKYATYAYILP